MRNPKHACSLVQRIVSDKAVKDAIEGYTYNDIFSNNLKVQEQMISIWQKKLQVRSVKTRIKFQTNNEDSSSQASPFFGASYTSDSVVIDIGSK